LLILLFDAPHHRRMEPGFFAADRRGRSPGWNARLFALCYSAVWPHIIVRDAYLEHTIIRLVRWCPTGHRQIGRSDGPVAAYAWPKMHPADRVSERRGRENGSGMQSAPTPGTTQSRRRWPAAKRPGDEDAQIIRHTDTRNVYAIGQRDDHTPSLNRWRFADLPLTAEPRRRWAEHPSERDQGPASVAEAARIEVNDAGCG